MSFILRPCELALMILASWVNQQQQEVIEYLRTENQILKETLGKKRILLNVDQRRRLAVKGKVLVRKMLQKSWHAVHAGQNPSLAPNVRR
jgi:hypothetical protein